MTHVIMSFRDWSMHMAEEGCATCGLRAKYDDNPRSFLGRLWRWHINFCPGWKAYYAALPPEEQTSLAEQYQLKGRQ